MIETPTTDGVDVEALYEVLGRRLVAIVARRVTAPEALIEDACQTAWSRLLRNRRTVAPEAAPSWLVTTAVREALTALRRQRREAPFQDGSAPPGSPAPAPAPAPMPRPGVLVAPAPGPEELTDARLRIARIRELPARQQKLVWLHGLGYGYAEIGLQTGDSTRTVERQLKRARNRLRALAA